MKENSFLEKKKNGRSRHRERDAKQNNEVEVFNTPVTENVQSNEEVSFVFKPIPREAARFVREIPTDIDLDTTDIPPKLLWVLNKAGLNVVRRDRKGGSHLTLTDGTSTYRLLHSEIVQMLRNYVAELDVSAKRAAELKEEISSIEKALSKEAPVTSSDKEHNAAGGGPPEGRVSIAQYRDMEIERKARAEQLVKMYGKKEGESLKDQNFQEPVAIPLSNEVAENPPTITQGTETPDYSWATLQAENAAPTETGSDDTRKDFLKGAPEDVVNAMNVQREKTRRQLESIKDEAGAFDVRFTEEFGISKEELESIDNFSSLSVGQQKLLFENFSQSVYAQVHNEAYEKHKLETEEKRKEIAESEKNFVIKAWAGMREAFKEDFNLLQATKETGIFQKNAGFESHKEMLNFLVQSMYRSGPRVHEDPRTGELLVDLVNMREWPSGENRKQQKLASQELNKAAHAFAKIPLSWKEQTLGVDGDKKNEWKITAGIKSLFFKERKQGNTYDSGEVAYMEAKAHFAETLRQGGMNETEIVSKLIEIDTRTQQLQMLQTSPDAVKELSNIEDKNVWLGAARSLVSSKGVYFGLGFVGRSVAGATVGFVGAPLVASALAGIRSWNKTAAELRERDRLARMGAGDTNESSLNIVAADGLYAKTASLLGEAYTTTVEMEKAYAEALEKGDSEEMDRIAQENARVLNRLQARVRYIQDKEGLQRINYGTGPQAYAKHAALLGLLGEASIFLEENYAPKESKITARLDRMLNRTDSKIMDARGQYRKKDRNSQIIKALGFSVGGAALAHFSQGVFEGKQTSPRITPNEAPADTTGERGAPHAAAPDEGTSNQPQVDEKALAERPAETPQAKERELPIEYKIQKGDSLLKIIEKNPFPNSSNGEAITPNEALRMLRSLSTEELKGLGIRSGNIDLIYANEKLDLEALREKMIEHEHDQPVSETSKVEKEDHGDFKGGAYERTDPIDTPIRESETPDTRGVTEGFINENPGGENSTPEASNTVDLITQRKAEIMQEYFFKINKLDVHNEVWKSIKNEDPQWYRRPVGIPPEQWKDFGPLIHIIDEVRRPPFNLIEHRGETVEKFTKRMFVEIARHDHSTFTPELRKLLNQVSRSGSYT